MFIEIACVDENAKLSEFTVHKSHMLLRSTDRAAKNGDVKGDEGRKEEAKEDGKDEEGKKVSVGKVKELVSREKEDLDEIILTKTRLEKGIQVLESYVHLNDIRYFTTSTKINFNV